MKKTLWIVGSVVLLVAGVLGNIAQPQVGSGIPAKYQQWLDEEVVYIMHPTERDVLLRLQTDKERDAFIDAFWKARDPDPATGRNEFREEHYLRLDYVNERFSTASLPGWRTDAGRLYIVTGARPSGLPGRTQPAVKLRFFEGIKEGVTPAPVAVTSSFLRSTISASYEAEADLAREQGRLAGVFNLQSVKLVTEAEIDFSAADRGRYFHTFQLDGKQYVVAITGLKGLARREFRVVVDERLARSGVVLPQGGEQMMRNVLDTEIILPVEKTAVFGFQDAAGKPYFLSINIAPPPPPQLPAPPSPTAKRVRPVSVPVPPSPPPEKAVPAQPTSVAAPPSPPEKTPLPAPPPPPPQDRAAFEKGAVRLEASEAPRLLKRVEPRYPQVADQARVEGTVVLDVRTDIFGRVKGLKVSRSIPLLDQAAYDAVRQWIYEPVLVEDKPVEAVFPVTVTFVLGAHPGVDVPEPLPEDISIGAVEVVGELAPPRLLKYVDPRYPEIARQARVEGHVILAVRTDVFGRVEAFKVLRSIPLLDQAAVDCVKQWVYEPLLVDGQPRKAAFTVTVRFELGEKPEPPARPDVPQEPSKAVPAKRLPIPASFLAGAVMVEEGRDQPKRLKAVDPVYPTEARMARMEGTVILAVRTDEQGRVEEVMVLRSIPKLNPAAIDAVRQWVYEPLIVDGQPRKAVFPVTVIFKLK